LGVESYEGLPPEVGAFNFGKWPHAPWPVHNFVDFGRFLAIFDSRGVGVIPVVLEGVDGIGVRVGCWCERFEWLCRTSRICEDEKVKTKDL